MKISVLQSYLFWMDRFKEKPEMFHGYRFPDSLTSWNRAINFGDCPFCNTYKVFRVKWKHWDENMYCLCSLLETLEEKQEAYRPYESIWTESKLETLRPYDNPKGAGEDLLDLLRHVREWYCNLNYSMFISGEPGSGKTHILSSIRTKFPGMTLFVDAARFQQKLFDATKQGNVADLLRLFSSVPILLFDDFGLEHGNAWTTDAIASVVNTRYQSYRDFLTVMTTNLMIDGLVDSTNIAIRRIADRMVDGAAAKTFRLRQTNFRETRQMQP